METLGPFKYVSSNIIYKGQYKYGLKHGAGFEEIENTLYYEGEYFNDNFHGKGMFVNMEEENLITGNFVHGKPEGYVFIIRNFEE